MNRENATKEELVLIIKELEERLRESEHHLQDLSETSLDWFWKTDAQLRFTEVSERYFEITGVPVQDVLGKTRMELVSESEQIQNRERWQQHTEDLEQRRPFRNLEYAIKGTHGLTRHVRISGKPVFNSRGEFAGYVGTGTNESDRIETQVALEQTKIKLMQSEKLASVGQLAAGTAHEINTPLGIIGLNLDALGDYVSSLMRLIEKQDELLPNNPALVQALTELKEEMDYDYLKEDLPNLISQSKDSVTKVSQIISGLKEFALAGDQNWSSIDVNQALEHAVAFINTELQEKILIIWNQDEIPNISGIPSQLKQVFLCLLLNAVQAIESRGVIEITTTLISDGSEVQIEIKDDGVGIEEELLTKIFEPFFTTKEVGCGSGLGLSMAYGIIKAHQGVIDVDSHPGAGSTFRIKLPVQQNDG